ncbi:MAG: T9SS type A sorting domain-containing protein [Chlorobi bacterium]|nr:T9SS type A sorting domain-containing protein [Chlorobiota bacterium]
MKKYLLLLLIAISSSFSMNAQTSVSGTISNNATWTSAGSPYIVTGNITVDAGVTLTIESGTTVQFDANTYIQVYGTLNANGATFTANGSTTPGYWDGIYVGYIWNTNIGEVTLDGCTIEYAQSIYARKGTLTITNNSVLNNFSRYGVEIQSEGILNIDNTAIQNCLYPVCFTGDGNMVPGENVSLTGNTNDYVYLNLRDITKTVNFEDAGIPYYFAGELRVTETGEMKASAGVVFLGTQSAYINVYGKFKVQGSVTDSVTFGKVDSESYWKGITFYDSSVDTACFINYAKFSNASYSYYRTYDIQNSALSIEESSPQFSNCVFSGNNYNVVITGRSFPVFTDCSFGESVVVGHNVSNINIDMNAEPVFNNCSIAFNEQEGRAIGIIGATVYDDSHFKQIAFNGYDKLPYVLFGNVTIQDTATLTLDPGLVFKCSDNDYYILANGVLEAVGTETEPIIFTHINDDNYGTPGDTYNDGSTTINHSSSGRLLIRSSGTSHLEYWKILYAGYSNSYNNYAVEITNNNVLKNSVIKNSYYGVLFSGSAQLLNNSFEDIDYYPLARQMNDGSPSLIGNSISNTGYLGIFVKGFDSGDYSIGGLDFAGYTNVAYIFRDMNTDIPEDANVTVLPGTVFKFDGYYYSRLTVKGGLKAEGTTTDKIIFTSIYDNSVAGNTNFNSGDDPTNHKWNRLIFEQSSNSSFNSLNNVEVRYYRESVLINDCNVTIDASTFNFSESHGLSILGNSASVISNSEFNNMGGAPIQIDMFASPTFSGNSMANVAMAGISIHGGTVNGTVPVRSFAGYDNITYLLDENILVDNELIIPAGVVFKGDGDEYLEVTGKLTIQGTSSEPVVFTAIDDDAYGNPADTRQNGVSATVDKRGCHIVFRESSDDASVVDYTLFRYMYNHGIYTMDASPSITNCTFYNANNEGIMLRGQSFPVLTGNTFEDCPFPMTIDPTAYPATATGNQLTGTTGKAIMIYDNATLTQDATLAKHAFGGMDNIPYMFYRYTVGTSAVLTINPGVVCKFKQYGYLTVRKGLIADGGSTVDSTIVFTSDRDDFYGGDTYGDGDASEANDHWWYGIYFPGESIDASCILDNCVVKNASRNYYNTASTYNYGAVTLDNSSPVIHNTLFEDDYWGILARNTSLPDIDNCDFVNMNDTYGYGIWNETGTVTIVAENCWWNDVSGPYHPTLNSSGQGERVSDNVDFDPWISQPAQPLMGDVSLNGEVMPYDASLVLQSTVGNITLDAKQQEVADVSFNGSVTSYDASLILQYTIGLITGFEPASGTAALKSASIEPEVTVSVPYDRIDPETTRFEIPIAFTTGETVKSMDMEISSNPADIKFTGLNNEDMPSDLMIVSGYDENTGEIRISVASANDLELNENEIKLVFEYADTNAGESEVKLETIFANENNDEDTVIIYVGSNQVTTAIDNEKRFSDVKLYAYNGECVLDIELQNSNSRLIITVYNLAGQTTNTIVTGNVAAGHNHFTFRPEKTGASISGIYIVKVRGDDFVLSRKVIVK